ncbi:MAG: GNAT family N-acetyltransferase [Candidatus Pacearchaeota archaeon]|nr:MAG: GNAT family N-acetyltransferase [Candidatus Pacearchaeota archaeon]
MPEYFLCVGDEFINFFLVGEGNPKIYLCPTCYKEYKRPGACIEHYTTKEPINPFFYCKLIRKTKPNKEQFRIFKITWDSPHKFKKALSNLTFFSKIEQGLDFCSIPTPNHINPNNFVYMVVNKYDFIVGYICVKRIYLKKEPQFKIYDLFVIPPFRRKRIATLLYRVVCKDLKILLSELFHSYIRSHYVDLILKKEGLQEIKILTGGRKLIQKIS